MLDSVLLPNARVSCLGNERGELLCAKVVGVLLQAGSAPLVQRRMATRRRSQQLAGTFTLKRLRRTAQERLKPLGGLMFG